MVRADSSFMEKRLVKSGVGVILIKIIGIILTFVTSIILARGLGAEGYGFYSLLVSVMMLLSIPIQSGIPTLAVRETTRAIAINDHALVKELWSWANGLVLKYFSFLCLIVALFVFYINQWKDAEQLPLFFIGFFSIPLLSLILIYTAIIRGFGEVILGSLPDGLIRPIVNLLIIVAIFLSFSESKMPTILVIAAYLASALLTFLISLFLLRKSIKRNIEVIEPIKLPVNTNAWHGTLSILTIVGGAQMLFGYVDTLILGIYRTDSDIGVYRVAVQISMLVSFGLTVLNQVLQPHFSRLNLARKSTKLQNLVNVSSLVIFIAAAIPALALVFFGDQFINFVYGNDYIMGLTALKILVVGQLANTAFGSVGALLNMTGNEKYAAKGMLLAVFVNIALNFMFIPIWGIEGAAFSSAISLIVWNGMLRFYVKRQLGIESSGITNYLVKIFTFYRSN